MGSFNGITYAFGQWNKKKELDIRSSFNSNMQYWGAWLHDLKKKKEKGFYERFSSNLNHLMAETSCKLQQFYNL